MALIRSVIASLAMALMILGPIGALAANPCKNTYALQQINAQKHQLEQQKRLVEQQYRGPGNAAARRSALAQIDGQMDALETQKRALKAQQRDCKQDRKGHKHKDKD